MWVAREVGQTFCPIAMENAALRVSVLGGGAGAKASHAPQHSALLYFASH